VNDTIALLDVNVPMYAAGQAHPYKEPCVWIMAEVAEGRLSVAVDAEAVQEILYRYGELQQWETGLTLASSLLDLVPTVYPVSLDVVRLTLDLFRQYAPQGIKTRDLIHVAVMHNQGLTKIISTDRHFDRIAGLVRVDPQALWTQARSSLR
jgi:predicted nucleic acid-binding protein